MNGHGGMLNAAPRNRIVQTTDARAMPIMPGERLHHHNGQPALTTFTLCAFKPMSRNGDAPHARRSTAIMEVCHA